MHKLAGKQAARGQRQIYDENRSTILYYSLASGITSALCLLLHLFLSNASTGTWVGWSLSGFMQLCAIGLMVSMVKNIRNEKNQIVDAGLDLNDPQAFGEYCKDTVILCSGAHLLSIVWAKFYWILALLPAFGLFKLWTNVLGPWFFAQPYEEEIDEKKQKKREKKIYIRR